MMPIQKDRLLRGSVMVSLFFILSASHLLVSVRAFAQADPGEQQKAKAILHEAAVSKDPTVRIQAIETIGLIGVSDDVRAQLESFLTDKNVSVRIMAVKALEEHKFKASIPSLEKLLSTDKVPEVKFAAAEALDALGNPQGRAWLIAICNGSEKASSDLVDEQSRKFFANFHSLESSGEYIMKQGVGYVPVPGVSPAFSAITDLISDPGLSPRAAALMLVSRHEGASIDGLLRDALKEKDWSLRASAALMIAFTERVELRQALVPLFHDENDKVRLRAAGAYLHLASPSKNGALPYAAVKKDW